MSCRRGRLIALEGPDGCGKTTQAFLLARCLGAVPTREPGGTRLGESIRTLVLGLDGPAPSPPAEAMLMLASRAQHVAEVIEPALGAGRWVVTDRYAGSTLAYQGYGRGLSVEELRAMSSWATGGLWPDLSILLERAPIAGEVPDRLEAEEAAFHARVAAGFRSLAAADPAGWAVVDGSGTVEDVAARVLQAVVSRLGGLPGG